VVSWLARAWLNGWAVSRERMEELEAEGRLHFPSKPGGRIEMKRYLDERKGMPVANVWDDIDPVNSQATDLRRPAYVPSALPITSFVCRLNDVLTITVVNDLALVSSR
jgi:hypothetical protein